MDTKIAYAPLSKEEEIALFRRFQSGDTHAGNRILLAHRPLVQRIATTYVRKVRSYVSQDDFEDYIQEGFVGLMKALPGYDPDIARFSTYASFWVDNALRLKDMNSAPFSGQSPHTETIRRRIVNEQKKSLARHGRHVTVDELAKNVGVKAHFINRELAQLRATYTSFQDTLSEDGTFADVLVDTTALSPELALMAKGEYQAGCQYIVDIEIRVKKLCTTRDADIFFRRHGLGGYTAPETLDPISQAHKVTRERVRQIVERIWKTVSRGEIAFTQEGLARARRKVLILAELH